MQAAEKKKSIAGMGNTNIVNYLYNEEDAVLFIHGRQELIRNHASLENTGLF